MQSEATDTLYKELRRIAASQMKSERGSHTLQPTALVNEAYLRLAKESIWSSRTKVLGIAAQAMRHILVDHARARAASKRGAGAVQVTLDEALVGKQNISADILIVDEALNRLAELDPRQARIVELHFFSGLTFDEIASELDVSVRTVKGEWAMARAWMVGQLGSHP
jgi:RNA polymerase sigma factor (TIGR02999 family)